jgi:hypothetical protein
MKRDDLRALQKAACKAEGAPYNPKGENYCDRFDGVPVLIPVRIGRIPDASLDRLLLCAIKEHDLPRAERENVLEQTRGKKETMLRELIGGYLMLQVYANWLAETGGGTLRGDEEYFPFLEDDQSPNGYLTVDNAPLPEDAVDYDDIYVESGSQVSSDPADFARQLRLTWPPRADLGGRTPNPRHYGPRGRYGR